MEEMASLEAAKLENAVESKKDVKIYTINGYQVMARIKDYDCNVIVAEAKGHEWVIYRHAVCTIEFV